MKLLKIRSSWNVELLETRCILSADPVSVVDSLVASQGDSQTEIVVDDTGMIDDAGLVDGSVGDAFTIDENGNYVDADDNIFEVDPSIFQSGVPFDGGHDYGYAVDENGDPLLTTMSVDPLDNFYCDEEGNMFIFADGEIQPNYRTLTDTDGEVTYEKGDLGEIAETGVTGAVDDEETLFDGEVMTTTDAEVDLGEIAQSGGPLPQGLPVDITTFSSLFSSLNINEDFSRVVITSADPLDSDEIPVLV